ncbi:response regulator transcription factor [Streptomyces sp. NPDC006923]|uniref:helix-turn-helix transcriptional regulator n=1 Tax=Streptomyces sp. NPDC006923 TaxID=3155355 RepID=UPI0033C5D579
MSIQDAYESGIPCRGPRAAGPGTPTPSARHTAVPISVAVYAEDVILRAGTVHLLRQRPEVKLVPDEEAANARISLVVTDCVNESTMRRLQRLQRNPATRTGLVVGFFEVGAIRTMLECGVAAVLRRADADQDELMHLITELARGEGALSGELLGKLIYHVGRSHRASPDPRSLTLSVREADMLSLVAEGFKTAEIAEKTSYSERTVKNVLHGLITRLDVRNRTQAVAFATRHGLI